MRLAGGDGDAGVRMGDRGDLGQSAGLGVCVAKVLGFRLRHAASLRSDGSTASSSSTRIMRSSTIGQRLDETVLGVGRQVRRRLQFGLGHRQDVGHGIDQKADGLVRRPGRR